MPSALGVVRYEVGGRLRARDGRGTVLGSAGVEVARSAGAVMVRAASPPPARHRARRAQTQLDAIARKLNTRPRKTLGYRTPADILGDTVASTG